MVGFFINVSYAKLAYDFKKNNSSHLINKYERQDNMNEKIRDIGTQWSKLIIPHRHRMFCIIKECQENISKDENKLVNIAKMIVSDKDFKGLKPLKLAARLQRPKRTSHQFASFLSPKYLKIWIEAMGNGQWHSSSFIGEQFCCRELHLTAWFLKFVFEHEQSVEIAMQDYLEATAEAAKLPMKMDDINFLKLVKSLDGFPLHKQPAVVSSSAKAFLPVGQDPSVPGRGVFKTSQVAMGRAELKYATQILCKAELLGAATDGSSMPADNEYSINVAMRGGVPLSPDEKKNLEQKMEAIMAAHNIDLMNQKDLFALAKIEFELNFEVSSAEFSLGCAPADGQTSEHYLAAIQGKRNEMDLATMRL